MESKQERNKIVQFKGMSDPEVLNFLNAFPKRRELAQKLTPLAAELNDIMLELDPEGIDTVIRIIDCLRVGDVSGAVRVYEIDGDKLHSYPKIESYITDNLLPFKNQD